MVLLAIQLILKPKDFFFEERSRSWLYASDEVVTAIDEMLKLVQNTNKGHTPGEGRKAVGDIVLAMRKDLIGQTKLSYEIFRYIDVIDSN